MPTEAQYQEAVNKKIDFIIKAANDIKENPEKAEKYIRETANNIYKAGKEIGKSLVTDELFF